MATIPQKQLRNDISDVLRRAEAGERFTITVAGRPVAELGPVAKRRWVPASALAELARLGPDDEFMQDIRKFPGGLEDPFERFGQ
jgi:prevent-host-death family protein